MEIDASHICTLAILSLFGILSTCLERGADNGIMAQVSGSNKSRMAQWDRTKIREAAVGKEHKERQKKKKRKTIKKITKRNKKCERNFKWGFIGGGLKKCIHCNSLHTAVSPFFGIKAIRVLRPIQNRRVSARFYYDCNWWMLHGLPLPYAILPKPQIEISTTTMTLLFNVEYQI